MHNLTKIMHDVSSTQFLFMSCVFLNSTFLYLKFLVVWALVLLADFVLEFRFEYLWPFWLFIRSVYDSFRYQGLVSGSLLMLQNRTFISQIMDNSSLDTLTNT